MLSMHYKANFTLTRRFAAASPVSRERLTFISRQRQVSGCREIHAIISFNPSITKLSCSALTCPIFLPKRRTDNVLI